MVLSGGNGDEGSNKGEEGSPIQPLHATSWEKTGSWIPASTMAALKPNNSAPALFLLESRASSCSPIIRGGAYDNIITVQRPSPDPQD
jgi:hypothetical protein